MLESKNAAFEAYIALRAKADAKFAEIERAHPREFACQSGCHSCCLPGLSVFAVEKAALAQFLWAHPERLARVRNLASERPHGDRRCRLLDEEGRCSVYEARPLVCRSHGAPLKFAGFKSSTSPRQLAPVDDRETKPLHKQRDVCPLNFSGRALEELPERDFIDLDTLNTLLSLINAAYTQSKDGKRTPLEIEQLLG